MWVKDVCGGGRLSTYLTVCAAEEAGEGAAANFGDMGGGRCPRQVCSNVCTRTVSNAHTGLPGKRLSIPHLSVAHGAKCGHAVCKYGTSTCMSSSSRVAGTVCKAQNKTWTGKKVVIVHTCPKEVT